MSNKKRIRKLLQEKYKPTRKVILHNEFVHGWDFAIAFEEAGKAAEKASKAAVNYLNQLQTISPVNFQRQYMNDPIQSGVVHPGIVFIDYNLSEKELTAIVDKLEKKRSDKVDPI